MTKNTTTIQSKKEFHYFSISRISNIDIFSIETIDHNVVSILKIGKKK